MKFPVSLETKISDINDYVRTIKTEDQCEDLCYALMSDRLLGAVYNTGDMYIIDIENCMSSDKIPTPSIGFSAMNLISRRSAITINVSIHDEIFNKNGFPEMVVSVNSICFEDNLGLNSELDTLMESTRVVIGKDDTFGDVLSNAENIARDYHSRILEDAGLSFEQAEKFSCDESFLKEKDNMDNSVSLEI